MDLYAGRHFDLIVAHGVLNRSPTLPLLRAIAALCADEAPSFPEPLDESTEVEVARRLHAAYARGWENAFRSLRALPLARSQLSPAGSTRHSSARSG